MKKVIVLISLIVITVIVILIYQNQKNKEIYDYCVKVYVKGGSKYLSLDECINMVKKAGGFDEFKKLLEEIK